MRRRKGKRAGCRRYVVTLLAGRKWGGGSDITLIHCKEEEMGGGYPPYCVMVSRHRRRGRRVVTCSTGQRFTLKRVDVWGPSIKYVPCQEGGRGHEKSYEIVQGGGGCGGLTASS